MAEYAGTHLGVSAKGQGVLKAKDITGRALMASAAGFLETHGLKAGDAVILEETVDLIRHGGPKTVRLCLNEETPGASSLYNFLGPDDFSAFLTRLGAPGLGPKGGGVTPPRGPPGGCLSLASSSSRRVGYTPWMF